MSARRELYDSSTEAAGRQIQPEAKAGIAAWGCYADFPALDPGAYGRRLLIDVIDYKHVHEGPSLILIADEGDYAYDLGDGQAGLQYIRKRFMPASLPDALRLVFRLALDAARRLEDDTGGRLRFDYAAAKISFPDRRHYRNQPAVFAGIRAELAAFLAQLYDDEIELARAYDDPRQIFAVRYSAGRAAVDMEKLHKRLGSGAPIR